MKKIIVLSGAAALVGALAAGAAAQEVISDPGKCAQYYPSANCQNYGPGNPYRGPQSYQQGWRNGYAWYRHPGHWRNHDHRY